ncbi:MAG: hypothetical protein ABSH22_17100 [Tepidisphaeraceae bacterium]|jgi:hypothetical protein
MVTSRRAIILATVAVGFAICTLFAGIYAAGYWFQHHGDGPTHTFPLDGNGPITDQEAIEYSKEVLISDGRFSSDLALSPFGNDAYVNRADDPAYATVDWRNQKTYREWFVQMKRLNGKVEAISYPGE